MKIVSPKVFQKFYGKYSMTKTKFIKTFLCTITNNIELRFNNIE